MSSSLPLIIVLPIIEPTVRIVLFVFNFSLEHLVYESNELLTLIVPFWTKNSYFIVSTAPTRFYFVFLS